VIVSEKHRYVYIAVPKAGSQAIARWLVENFDGSAVGYHHAWRVPPTYADYLVFTVVRNPYERCFSAWWFRCQEPSRQRGNPLSGWPFDRFMGSVLAHRQSNRRPDPAGTAASMTQKQFAELSKARLAFQLERPQDLALLPFVAPEPVALPHQNETASKPRGSFADHFGAAEEQLVWDYCAEDFAAFGYPRLTLPPPLG
jgi:hypothetical protein